MSVEDFRKKETQMERELNKKEKDRDVVIKNQLENMTPKVPYGIANSKKNVEISIPNSQRLRVESLEAPEENKREYGVLKTAYQRESEIPRVPVEIETRTTNPSNVQSIPNYRYGATPVLIKLSEDKPEDKHQESYKSAYPPQFQSLIPPDAPIIPQQMTSMNQGLMGHMPMSQPMMMTPQMYMPYPPNTAYQNQPNQSYQNQPNTSYQGQPNPSYQIQPNPSYQNQPNQAYHNQQNQAYQSQQIPQYMQQPPRVHAAYQPPMAFSNDPNRRQVLYNPITKKPQNYKTMPCRKFHSNEGCERGDNCHFIHDYSFQGRPIPNFQEWKNNNQERQQNLQSGFGADNQPSYFPPMGYPPQ